MINNINTRNMRGMSVFGIIIIVVVLAILGVVGYNYIKPSQLSEQPDDQESKNLKTTIEDSMILAVSIDQTGMGLKTNLLTAEKIAKEIRNKIASSRPKEKLGNLCDYLTTDLVSKYISTPVKIDVRTSGIIPQEIACPYIDQESENIVRLQFLSYAPSQLAIDHVYENSIKYSNAIDHSTIGFKAWYIPNQEKGTVVLYFTAGYQK